MTTVMATSKRASGGHRAKGALDDEALERSRRETVPVLVVAVSPRPTDDSVLPSTLPPARRQRSDRVPLSVDEVGARAVQLARHVAHGEVPRVVLSKRALSRAPIDPRDGFILSFIDGHTSVASLVDMTAESEATVLEIVGRLVRLGIVKY